MPTECDGNLASFKEYHDKITETIPNDKALIQSLDFAFSRNKKVLVCTAT